MATISGYRFWQSTSGTLESGFYFVNVQDYHDFNGSFKPTGDLINQLTGSGNMTTSGTKLDGTGTNETGAKSTIRFNTEFPFLWSGVNTVKSLPNPLDGEEFTRGFAFGNLTSASGVTSGFGFYQRSMTIKDPGKTLTGEATKTLSGVAGPGVRPGTQVSLYRGGVASGVTITTVNLDSSITMPSVVIFSGSSLKFVVASEIGNVESNTIVVS